MHTFIVFLQRPKCCPICISDRRKVPSLPLDRARLLSSFSQVRTVKGISKIVQLAPRQIHSSLASQSLQAVGTYAMSERLDCDIGDDSSEIGLKGAVHRTHVGLHPGRGANAQADSSKQTSLLGKSRPRHVAKQDGNHARAEEVGEMVSGKTIAVKSLASGVWSWRLRSKSAKHLRGVICWTFTTITIAMTVEGTEYIPGSWGMKHHLHHCKL